MPWRRLVRRPRGSRCSLAFARVSGTSASNCSFCVTVLCAVALAVLVLAPDGAAHWSPHLLLPLLESGVFLVFLVFSDAS